jgi:hypothetical protein
MRMLFPPKARLTRPGSRAESESGNIGLRARYFLANNWNSFAEAGPVCPDHLRRFGPKLLHLEGVAVRIIPFNDIATEAASQLN